MEALAKTAGVSRRSLQRYLAGQTHQRRGHRCAADGCPVVLTSLRAYCRAHEQRPDEQVVGLLYPDLDEVVQP